MHSLSELRDFLKSREIEVKEYNGWQLKVNKDTWTLLNDVFYLNGSPQNLKEKGLFDKYKKQQVKHERTQSTQTRKWRGISSRNHK